MIGGTTIVIIYLVIAVIYFFLSLFLYRFASKMKIALNTTDQDSLNNSLGNLKTLYKTMGILTIEPLFTLPCYYCFLYLELDRLLCVNKKSLKNKEAISASLFFSR